MVPPKSWATRERPNNHVFDDRRFSCTVYGAIGAFLGEIGLNFLTGSEFLFNLFFLIEIGFINLILILLFVIAGACLKKPVYYFSYTTNAVEYKKFVKKVHLAKRNRNSRPLFYYDGHRAHTSGLSVSFVSQFFQPLQSVPYSSNFNRKFVVGFLDFFLSVAIETVWSVGKRIFLRNQLLNRDPFTEDDFCDLVLESLDSIGEDAHRGFLVANRRYIRRYLAGE